MLDLWILGRPRSVKRKLASLALSLPLLFGAAERASATDVGNLTEFLNALQINDRTINLTANIDFTGNTDAIPGVFLDVVIDGNGHTIDAAGQRPFFINSGTVTLIDRLQVFLGYDAQLSTRESARRHGQFPVQLVAHDTRVWAEGFHPIR